jgi:hopanoid biosynthesis associated protein HpnK
VRRLIINADDFGLTNGVNLAIQQAHQSGVVTSSTLMANSRAFAGAVALAHSLPGLSIGCHVVLVDGLPLLPAAQVPSLLEPSGQYRTGFADMATRAIRGKIDPDQVEAEATAQFRKLQSAGIAITHFDTHKHTHILPAILKPLLRAAIACGVPALRNPFAPPGSLKPTALLSSPQVWKRSAQMRLLGGFAGDFRAQVERSGLATTDGTVGIEVTGVLDETFFQTLVEHLPNGTWELVCHPGHNDAELDDIRTRLRQSRENELRVLTSTSARAALQQARVELISFRALA